LVELHIAFIVFIIAGSALMISFASMVQLQKISASEAVAADTSRWVMERILALDFSDFSDRFPDPNGSPVPEEFILDPRGALPRTQFTNQRFQVTYVDNFQGNPLVRKINLTMMWEESGREGMKRTWSLTFSALQSI